MQQEDISLILYDFEKAYDSVPGKLLWQAWKRQILTNQLYKLLETYVAITNEKIYKDVPVTGREGP
jgi:hypothetical protein